MRIPCLALVALCAAAAGAHAQVFVGVGGGLSYVGEPRVDVSHVGAALHLRAGVTLGPSTALVLEGAMNAMGTGIADSTLVFGPGGGGQYYQRFRRSLETRSVLASIQFGHPEFFYVRPGVGIARQGFLVQVPLANDGIGEEMRWETAPAVGLAIGRRVPIPGFPLNVEAAARWSGGDDSTNPRWSTGLQIVRVIRF